MHTDARTICSHTVTRRPSLQGHLSRYSLDELTQTPFSPPLVIGSYCLSFDDCYGECDQFDSEPACRLHHIHSSAVTSLANGVLLFLSGSQPSIQLHFNMYGCMICQYLITFLPFPL